MTPAPLPTPVALQSFLTSVIKTFVVESPLNRLENIDGSPMWDEPLVGFASGDDALFTTYKTVVGDFHLMPRAVVGDETAPVSIVSWILPTAKATRDSNRVETIGPSLRWNHTRFRGEDFNDNVRRHVVATLQEHGYSAVAPVLTASFKTNKLPNGPASTWSERHIAFAAGLGTFSLSDGLITTRGIAHRCGSVVYTAPCIPTPRPYTDHRQYCLFARDGSCGQCIDRCPAGAITAAGHDKIKCHAYLQVGLREWSARPGYVGSYAACGLCQTGVPCEVEIPT